MFAQVSGTVCHVPLLLNLMRLLPNEPVVAIAIATSASSLLKLTVVAMLGRCHDDVRDSLIPFFTWKTFCTRSEAPSDFLEIGLPNLVMWCAEGWAFQSLIIFAGFIGVEDLAA